MTLGRSVTQEDTELREHSNGPALPSCCPASNDTWEIPASEHSLQLVPGSCQWPLLSTGKGHVPDTGLVLSSLGGMDKDSSVSARQLPGGP